MYIESTIHPYHSIEKSNAHQNQPFLNILCYYIRIEEREGKREEKREEKKKKEGKNSHKNRGNHKDSNSIL